MLNSFYEDCVDCIDEGHIDWYRFLCDNCFPDIAWEDVSRDDMIEYLKNDADIEIRGGYAQVCLHPDHKNLSFEVEFTKEELADYYEDKKYVIKKL